MHKPLWKKVERTDLDFCFYCERPVLRILYELKKYGEMNKRTVEHIIPSSLGGCNSLDNLIFACYWCNSHRGCKSFVRFFHIVQKLKRIIEVQRFCGHCEEPLLFGKVRMNKDRLWCINCLPSEKQNAKRFIKRVSKFKETL